MEQMEAAAPIEVQVPKDMVRAVLAVLPDAEGERARRGLVPGEVLALVQYHHEPEATSEGIAAALVLMRNHALVSVTHTRPSYHYGRSAVGALVARLAPPLEVAECDACGTVGRWGPGWYQGPPHPSDGLGRVQCPDCTSRDVAIEEQQKRDAAKRLAIGRISPLALRLGVRENEAKEVARVAIHEYEGALDGA